ncbi:hypothetical protein ThvES_00019590 [Thiovulum sp. ES]|nr:hypothetical protein ThvES_00019590 [Thiovulum sp. ES]
MLPRGGRIVLQQNLQSSKLTSKQLSSLSNSTCEGELKNNLHADRDPLPEDNYLDGYTEGSTWFNTKTGASFVCLETNEWQTIWKNVTENSLGIHNTSSFLDINNLDDLYSINISHLKVKRVLNIYIVDTVVVLSGFSVNYALGIITFPKIETLTRKAIITYE